MLNFAPLPESNPSPQPYAEALARLASIRHALRLVDPFGGGPASDFDDEEIGSAWTDAPAAKRRSFDGRTERVIAGTAAGLEALLAERGEEREPNPAAARRIADEIRAGLDDVARLMLGGAMPASQYPSPDGLPLAL